MRSLARLAACATLVFGAAACSSPSAQKPADTAVAPTAPTATPTPAPPPAPDEAPVAKTEPVAPAPAPAPEKQPGYDFIDDVNILYRVVACGHTDQPLPDSLTHGDSDRAAKLTAIVEKHCKQLDPYIAKFREEYFDKARAWFVAHEPKDLPTTVVYPFGGGDVISALVAFPTATEITTLSLELAGDPRNIATIKPDDLDKQLLNFRTDIGPLINKASNSSVNLSDQQRNALAGQLSSHLLGLAVGGYEPVSVRYFTIADDGTVHYLEKDEIDADSKSAKSLRGNWKAPAFSQSFANVEVKYRKIGETTVRVHRHIAWNLSNDELKKHPGVVRHLEAKGKVAECVKGAHYLLWMDDFSTIRTYLLDHLVWMASDSTGIPPNIAGPAGMVQETYGRFDAPYLDTVKGIRADTAMRKLWANPTDKQLGFRFGYPDKSNHNHVMITRPKS